MFNYLLLIGLIYTANVFAEIKLENDKCRKLIRDGAKFNCVPLTVCPSFRRLVLNNEFVHCGIEAGVTKICCSSSILRFTREVHGAPQKNPYAIAEAKCVEYEKARYQKRPGVTNSTKLDCIKGKLLIYGGTTAIPKEFPHMALIGYVDPSKYLDDMDWPCGGTLISDRYVLTAAHCMRNGKFEATWVRLGELVINNIHDEVEPKDFRISRRIPHPKYNKSLSLYHNDIMLLELDTPVKLTPYIRPICLYTSQNLDKRFRNKGIITGWGKTDAISVPSKQLLKAEINFINGSECETKFREAKKLLKGYDVYDSEIMICAGDKQTDTCQSDSGGPLQVPKPNTECMFIQVAVTSFGSFICGGDNVATIYTKIFPYIPWIQSIVWP